MPRLRKGHAYRLSGMTPKLWQVPHPQWGTPESLVAVFMGRLVASRTWHGFEVRVGGKEQGMLFIPEKDLNKLTLQDLGVYHHGASDADRA